MITLPSHQSRTYTRLALLAICLGYFMTILDLTVVNVALVNIKEQLSANVTGLQWIVDGYSLVFASFLLIGGALGDKIGGKQNFLMGLALFTLASMLCSVAPSLLVLQIARALQGLGAALLVPTTLALVQTTFSEANERTRAIGVWAAAGTIGAIAGPVLGGLLVDAFGWRSIFLLNLPIGILCFLLTSRFVAPTLHTGKRSLDLPGQLISVLTLGMLTFALIEKNSLGGTSPLILLTYGGCILFFLLFLFREQKATDPMLSLKLFQEKRFSAVNGVAVCQIFVFYGSLFVFSLFLQQMKHYAASVTGLALLPEFGCAFLAASLSGRLLANIGSRRVMLIGLFLSVLGCFAFVFVDAKTSYVLLACMLAVFGFGLSLLQPATAEIVISQVPKTQSGIASGVLNASRQVGGVLGVAILGDLVGNQQTFIAGMHIAFVVAGGVLVLGFVSAWFFT
jgi:DHA2 family methylenomycin A resistance protein-like MFS transporter